MCDLCRHRPEDENPLLMRMDIMIGLQQRTLDLLRTALGVPHATPTDYTVAAPVAGTIYQLPASNVLGLLLNPIVCGNGTITLYLEDQHLPGAQQIIFRGSINGQPTALPLRLRMPPTANLAMSTDSNTGVPLHITYHIEPISPTEDDLFTFRKGL